MSRAIWTGTISFGLVNISVRLFPATRRKDVRFHEIDRRTGQRVRHQRVLPIEAQNADEDWSMAPSAESTTRQPSSTIAPPVYEPDSPGTGGFAESPANIPPAQPGPLAFSDIIKGFEVAPDQFVTVSREEIAQLQPERTRRIEIEQFVPWEQIDPVYLDTSYHVAPQREYVRPFRLLVEALAVDGKVGISWVVLRQKRHLAALRPIGGRLMLSTMFHADEVLPADDGLPQASEELSERELGMASLLINSMSGDFDAARYEDDYRRRLLELIESRSATARFTPGPAEEAASSGVESLMAALDASLKQVQERSSPATPTSSPAEGAGRPSGRKRHRGAA